MYGVLWLWQSVRVVFRQDLIHMLDQIEPLKGEVRRTLAIPAHRKVRELEFDALLGFGLPYAVVDPLSMVGLRHAIEHAEHAHQIVELVGGRMGPA